MAAKKFRPALVTLVPALCTPGWLAFDVLGRLLRGEPVSTAELLALDLDANGYPITGGQSQAISTENDERVTTEDNQTIVPE
jgi:hypothetical protein